METSRFLRLSVLWSAVLLYFFFFLAAWPCVVHCRYQIDDSSEEVWPGKGSNGGNVSDVGLSPPVFNLARHAHISANGTCGEHGDETYCKLTEHIHHRPPRPSQCQVCSADSPDKSKRHPIKYAIDESNRWWQSPTLQNGRQFEWITITIDLKKIYQVAYIIIKAAISPRPGNWILERSKDGVDFLPWQYFAVSDDECRNRYGIQAKPGKPSYVDDDEVICTSYFSRITPFEGGEIHTSLINGRPGAESMSEKLTKFTMARFIRFRLQKIRTLHGDLMTLGGGAGSWDKTVMRRYFYSIKDIAIGGSCVCFGHARECIISEDESSPTAKCMCQHNTCGDSCDVCCPLFNHYQWGAGNSTDSAACEQCQCYGHAESCVYDPLIHEKRLSINTFGTYDGGGVCLDCKAHTKGVNCEKCEEGFYRPKGVPIDDPNPCVRCNCSSLGSMGYCVPSEAEAESLGKSPGDCICKDGYAGRNCDRCARGYKGFPNCEPCPCNLAGIVNLNCEGDCVCKENVEGPLCNTCKKGFFNLDQHNPDGCTRCFCNEVSDLCVSSNFPVVYVNTTDREWFVTDLHGTKVAAAQRFGDVHHVANEEFAAFTEYYWTVGEAFSGKKILSYGLQISFHVSWVQARGDTSGRPIPEFDVIIQSTSMLAFSHKSYEGDNATISVVLNELNCFVLEVDNNVIQRLSSTSHQERPCTRSDVMEGLSDIKRVLLRAKYHTDQIEGMLHWASFATADTSSMSDLSVDGKTATSVEICTCPKGYSGTSCENCDYSYRKSSKDSWLNVCIKCDCNGHASCDLNGNCEKCEHNTTGTQCEFCIEGFFGDPKTESPFSCKPCECPLSVATNNFSPTCVMSGDSYQCTACLTGYEGPFCERCSNGYYGNPAQEGDFCKPCTCNSEILTSAGASSGSASLCDHLTGECLVCPRNTIGWNCDECLEGHYGDPLNGTCIPCECDDQGSLNENCDLETGQCYCKQNFEGRHCSTCLEGHGSPKEGCPVCDCNPLGSESLNCDRGTGQCPCKPGIGGKYCNKCLELHYGFGYSGCAACDCHSEGSDSAVCDLNTGQCHCLAHVEGLRCEACSTGYWNIGSGQGCEKCGCDAEGSLEESCDMDTGQCYCRHGVGGLGCDHCLNKHYGFSADGCKECDPCDKLGHVCDADDGRCVCPPNTEGPDCEKCRVGFWGHSLQGCQECNCSQQGSSTPQCAPDTGKCPCMPGYEGDKCDVCKFGYFNYPTCTPCECDAAGTLGQFCDSNGVCSCTEEGHCQCRDKVIGKKCDRCQEGSYGLDIENPEGCMTCFCFQRTNRCSQGYFKWQRLGMLNMQKLVVRRTLTGGPRRVFLPYLDRQDGCYMNLALPTDRYIRIQPGQRENQLRSINNLIVIPDTTETILIENDISFGAPLYWQLPHIFLGDKLLSYNGFLRFHIGSSGPSSSFPPSVLSSYPLVQIQRSHKLILEYFPSRPVTNGFFEVRLQEDLWRRQNGPDDGVVSKETMMVALQNIQHILIRATHSPEVFNVSLFNVSLDLAVPHNEMDTTVAHGIEVCDCPPEYNSTSCQNPKQGYYRWYQREYVTSTIIIDLVGQAKPCECNGRSDICDTETGHCLNCSGNTGGSHCDACAPGYYGDPSENCFPCRCPSIYSNHADACKHLGSNNFQCFCKAGYTGKSCDRCDYGYFGNPWEPGGSCQPCRCNSHGSVSDECHENTGQCNCRQGVTGRDCSRCSGRHVIIGKVCTSCDDQCTGALLNWADSMGQEFSRVNLSVDAAEIWKLLARLDVASQELVSPVTGLSTLTLFIDDLPTFSNLGKILLLRMEELLSLTLSSARRSSRRVASRGNNVLQRIGRIHNEMSATVATLENYHSNAVPHLSHEAAQEEARQILGMMKEFSVLEAEAVAAEELERAEEINVNILELVGNGSQKMSEISEKWKSLKEKLEDLESHLSSTNKDTETAEDVVAEAMRIWIIAQERKERADNITMEMDVDTLMAADKLSETGHFITEADQVLQMMEDILVDLRNLTKEVEMRENSFFDLVPLYRLQYAQPAFDHVEVLKNRALNFQAMFRSIELSGSEPLKAVTAYKRIFEEIMKALESSSNASSVANEAATKIQTLLATHSMEDVLRNSSVLIEQGLSLSGIVENSIRTQLQALKSGMDGLTWRLRHANETLRSIFNGLEKFDENLRLEEFTDRIMEVSDQVEELSNEVQETETRVNKIVARVNAIRGGATLNPGQLTVQIENVRSSVSDAGNLGKSVETKIRQGKLREQNLDERLRKLRALIAQSRHKSDTVGVAISPDDTGTCFRLYKWPLVDDATSIVFNFAPTRHSDALLFYWPSSITDDYISIEMVSRHIKASWQLGSGLRTLVHPYSLVLTENSDDPDHWVRVTLDRVGSAVSLEVKGVDDSSSPSTAIHYQNSEEEATLLNLAPDDLIHVGGMSKLVRPGLVTNGLSGCVHKLIVNRQEVGLWNFVGNEGCSPCTECLEESTLVESTELDYYFDGRGYALVERVEASVFNPRFFELTMEFRTYAETALLFLTVNEKTGQMISLELREGIVVMQVRHSWENTKGDWLRIESVQVNTGDWVKVRAVWIFQNNIQTGQLTIGTNNFKQTKESFEHALELFDASYQIGGMSPAFSSTEWRTRVTTTPFAGCMKNVLIDSSTYDLMSGFHFGIEYSCIGKKIHTTSFEGDGFGEYSSPPLGKDFVFGFSFKTLAPTGILVLSSFARTTNNSPAEPYYGVYLENGRVGAQFGVPHGPTTVSTNDTTRFDDGKFHAFRLVKKNRRIILFVDDVEVAETRLPKKSPSLSAPANGGLYIGGLSESVAQRFGETSLKITRGFQGCIQNIFFGRSLLNLNHPMTYQNQHFGQCPPHFNQDSATIPANFLYPAAVELPGIMYDRPYVDHDCIASQTVIEQEDSARALHFGDDFDDSYALVSLVRSKNLRQNFNLTFSFRTFYPNGLFLKGLKQKSNSGHCLTSYLSDGQVVVRLIGDRPQALQSAAANLNDGLWHTVTIVKAEDKLLLWVDSNVTQAKVSKMKPISSLYVGGFPQNGQGCLESQKPDNFKGCLGHLVVNSVQYNFNKKHTVLHNVSPCFKEVEPGTFFKPGGFAIYSHNFTLGNVVEIELEFRSDAQNGVLLSFIPSRAVKYPSFAIFLQDGQVIARESFNETSSNEAVEEFPAQDPGYVCDGNWHSIQASYENGAITFRVDSLPPKWAVVEPVEQGGSLNYVSGSLFIGGVEDGAGRSTKKSQFQGCIRNVVINRQRKDWTDMAQLSNLLLNACPS